MTTSTQIANRALEQIGAQATVAGLVPNLTGGGAASAAINTLYPGVVAMLLREQEWEFARTTAPLVATGNTPLAGWSYEYGYPADCVRVLQVVPSAPSANDPQPVAWSVQDHPIAGTPATVILADTAAAGLTYITNLVTEAQWDSLFQEAMVRALAAVLSVALAGRPDFSREKMAEAGQIMGVGSGKDS